VAGNSSSIYVQVFEPIHSMRLINWRSMCGRYRLTAKERYLRDHFGLDDDPPWRPRWNIAPTQQIATICQHRSEPKRIFGLMRWGLIPHWAKDPSIGLKTINAMSETAAEKPAFRDAMKWRRCLIPADGFYEWKRLGSKKKQPYNFGMADDSPFAFAGLWELRHAPDGELIQSCTILTTKPNSLIESAHDRMPVILDRGTYDLWSGPGITNPARVSDCLKPFDARLMRKYPVSTRVNHPDHDDPECAEEAPAVSASQMLF
jgi:putative SOS response-associated peptidase YedK